MDVQKDTPIGHIAAEHPAATRVFYRFGIDFCCGGGNSLEAVCNARGIDPGVVLDAVREELLEGPADGTNWMDVDLNVLIDHILVTFHKPLREELPRLDAMMAKVSEVHREKDARLAALHLAFAALRAELDAHMMKEEQILFPMICQGQGESASGPVSVMEHEHDSAAAALRKMRELTDGFRPPDEACTTWRAMLHGLEGLEREVADRSSSRD